jgi:AbrB family looped-hinge helix DNA binding protein
MHTKVTKRGQVSVPAEVCKKLHIGPNTKLAWIIEGDAVKVIALPTDPIKAFRGSGTKGLTQKLQDERKKDSRTNVSGSINPLLRTWAQAGIVSLPKNEKQPLQPSCISSPEDSAPDLLDSDRKEPGD